MTATDHAVTLVEVAARAASDKLATDLLAFDVSEQLAITDAFLLASASNDRQVKAVVDEIEDKLRDAGAKPIRREGQREGRWVLLDYGEIVVHVQHEEERAFYALERLWRDCPDHPAAGGRHAPAWLTRRPHAGSSCSGTAAPPGTTRRGPRATPTSRSTRSATRRRPPWRRTSPPCGPSALWTSDLARARETAAYLESGDRADRASSTPGSGSTTSASAPG